MTPPTLRERLLKLADEGNYWNRLGAGSLELGDNDIALLREAAAALASPESGRQDDLHQQIMNLPCHPKGYGQKPEPWLRGYRYGHKDARHAAAELVAAPPSSASASPKGTRE